MPYKDKELNRLKGRGYTAAHRAKVMLGAPEGACTNYTTCRNMAKPGGKRCEPCLEYMREYKKTYRQREKPEGVCSNFPDCNQPSATGLRMCRHCLDTGSRNQKKSRPTIRARNSAIQYEVFEHYGPQCACCGEENFGFLSIDHIGGNDGSSPKGGIRLYRWLKSHGFPEGFRTLCMNCNFCLGHHGYCPHGELTQPLRVGRKALNPVDPLERAKNREYWIQYKRRVYDAYGGPVCACCGETIFEFLTLDHIDGGGADHRREIGHNNVLIWCSQNNFPPGFRVLCTNCNWSARHSPGNICVHRRSSAQTIAGAGTSV